MYTGHQYVPQIFLKTQEMAASVFPVAVILVQSWSWIIAELGFELAEISMQVKPEPQSSCDFGIKNPLAATRHSSAAKLQLERS